MNKKNILLVVFLLFYGNINTYANVDSTNPYTFQYNCIEGEGVLNSSYNLGGHHYYNRSYKIPYPGIIEVADSKHVTIAKSALISIGGCGYTIDSCTPITSSQNYEFVKNKKIDTLDVISDKDLTNTGSEFIISGFNLENFNNNSFWNHNKSESETLEELFELEEKIYSGEYSGFELKGLKYDYNDLLDYFDVLEDNIVLKTKTQNVNLNGYNVIINIEKNNYNLKVSYKAYKLNKDVIIKSGTLIYRTFNETGISGEQYSFDVNGNSIDFNEKLYQKVQKGVTDSIPGGGTITYEAFDGNNTGNSSCSNPNTYDKNYTSGGYCTGLNYWDYTQHNYTTTKVTLHSVKLSCNIYSYTDGTNKYTANDYNGTLSGIIQPYFGGDVKFEIEENLEYGFDSEGYLNFPATKSLNISGLKYLTVGEIAGNPLGVDNVIVSIKQNDYTLGTQKFYYGRTISAAGSLPDLNNLVLKKSTGENITTIAGNYQIVFTFYNSTQLVGNYTLPITIYPNNNLIVTKNLSSGLVSNNFGFKLISGTDIVADGGNSYYEYEGYLTDNYGNLLTSLPEGRNVSVFVSEGGDRNLLEGGYGETIGVDYSFDNINNKINLKIFSYAPFNGEVKLNIKYQEYDYDNGYINQYNNVDFNTGVLNFNKYFTAELLGSTDGVNYNDLPKIGVTMNYKLKLVGDFTKVDNFSIDSFISYIGVTDTNTVIEEKNITSSSNGIYSFDARLNSKASINDINPGIKIANGSVSGLVVNYNIDGHKVRYYLNDDNDPTSKDYISLVNGGNQLGLKVFGYTILNGKESLLGISSVSKSSDVSNFRDSIRKKSYDLIKTMKSGDIVNGFKYVSGDYTLESSPSYNVLIITDGNLTIKNNINLDAFYIVVLQDNYDINNGYSSGNILITSNVTNINAFIYSDGGVISTDTSGNIFTTDSSNRTSKLNKQLYINGGLFTRNTVGGAILGDGKYLLPGGTETTDFNRALNYDLNYLRVGNNGWDLNNNSIQDTFEDEFSSLIIKQNSIIIDSMPSIFTN